ERRAQVLFGLLRPADRSKAAGSPEADRSVVGATGERLFREGQRFRVRARPIEQVGGALEEVRFRRRDLRRGGEPGSRLGGAAFLQQQLPELPAAFVVFRVAVRGFPVRRDRLLLLAELVE